MITTVLRIVLQTFISFIYIQCFNILFTLPSDFPKLHVAFYFSESIIILRRYYGYDRDTSSNFAENIGNILAERDVILGNPQHDCYATILDVSTSYLIRHPRSHSRGMIQSFKLV